jgi:hypothetical protein
VNVVLAALVRTAITVIIDGLVAAATAPVAARSE